MRTGPRALVAAASGLAFGAVVDISPITTLLPPHRAGPQLVAQVARRGPPPPPPPPPKPPAPAIAPALIALGCSYLFGFVTGALLARRRAKAKAVAAAALRSSSGRDALQRARAVLDISMSTSSQKAGALSDASPASLLQARAAAAEAGLSEQTAQLRELQAALTIAGSEFEEALAEKDEALEEAELLRQILAEKEAQIRSLEALANEVVEVPRLETAAPGARS